MSSKAVELKKLTKSDAGKFQQTGQSKIKLANGEEYVIPIKSLGVNIQERLEDEFPYPEVPVIKRFNKATHQWEHIPNDADPEFLHRKKEIDSLRTYAVVLWGTDLEIEGATFEEKIKTLIDTGLPAGAFTQLSQDILKLSQVEEETFQ